VFARLPKWKTIKLKQQEEYEVKYASFDTIWQCLEQNYVNCKAQPEFKKIKSLKIHTETEYCLSYSEVWSPALVF